MNISRASGAVVLAVVVAALGIIFSPTSFGAQRTFVASTGVDTNPCSIAGPCRSFGTALTHTDPAGEIIVLDSAGYGSVTIAQSVSILAPTGVYAGITVFPGFDGVVVNGAGVDVTLKGLSINGQGGNVGINFMQGTSLVVEGCTVTAMGGDGIFASAAGSVMTVADTVVRRNANGIDVAGNVQASFVRVRAESNASDGIRVSDGARGSVADSVAVNNGFAGVHAENTIAATTQLSVDRLESRGNVAGVIAHAAPPGSATIAQVTRSNLSQNSITGMQLCCTANFGTALGSLTDSLIANNGNSGVGIGAPAGGGWVLTVGGNRIVDNIGNGLFNSGSNGTLYTRSDNTLVGNPTSGALTPLAGQ